MLASTGTNGKTSTAWWAAQALSQLGRRCAVIGTLGSGEPGANLTDTGLTTPDAVQLAKLLRGFVDAGFGACALEASSIGIDEQRLNGTRIDVALYTNLSLDHLDYHGSMQAYWLAKRRLFAWPGLRAAVVNVDDAHGAALAVELHGGAVQLWTCSLREGARLVARDIGYHDGGLGFSVHEGPEAADVRSRLIGAFNVSNLLLVIGALRALDVPLATAAQVLARLDPVPGRMQRVACGSDAAPEVVVDYAHTPDALDKALQALRPFAAARGGRLWCVFGCGGNRDSGKRAPMGEIAARLADRVVLTSDNPRHEDPLHILAQIRSGAAGAHVHTLADRREAIAHAVREAAAEDVVLLAGKGHEVTQDVAGVRSPFVDADEAARALRQRSGTC